MLDIDRKRDYIDELKASLPEVENAPMVEKLLIAELREKERELENILKQAITTTAIGEPLNG